MPYGAWLSSRAHPHLNTQSRRDSLLAGYLGKPVAQYHHGNLRTALLERAEHHLATGGSNDLSLRRLARDIGVSHDAPRHHFASKQALLDALAERGFQELGAEVEATLHGSRGSLASRLTLFIQTYVNFARRHPALLELMFAAKAGRDSSALQEANDRAFSPVIDLIARGQASGQLISGDPDQIYMALWATMQGLASLINGGWLEMRDPDQVVISTARILSKGLRP
jgi:AcrR family transcriptional regulator